jgi:ketopantoate hydroxymethyltransferase
MNHYNMLGLSIKKPDAAKNNMPKITMLTAYNYPFAKIVDEAGCKE